MASTRGSTRGSTGQPRGRAATTAAVAMAALAVLALPAAAYPRPSSVQLISRTPDGRAGSGLSTASHVSANGTTVVFHSSAPDLVAGGSGRTDVYAWDRATGALELISRTPSGSPANGTSSSPTVSADGRLVVFGSSATDLDPDVILSSTSTRAYVHDRETGRTELAARTVDGTPANAAVQNITMSEDGTRVAFSSRATNLAPGADGQLHAFVYDRATRTTALVSKSTDGVGANASVFYPALSADGRYVSFHTQATTLVANDTNGQTDVFVHDLVTRRTERASLTWDGAQPNSDSLRSTISGDGRFVAFGSYATNLTPVHGSSAVFPYDVYVRDRARRTTERVSVSAGGSPGDSSSYVPTISADGRFVTFSSLAGNLVTEPKTGERNVFMHDRVLRRTERLGVGADGQTTDNRVFTPALSADGRYAAFASDADEFDPAADGSITQVFSRDRGPDLGTQRLHGDLSSDAVHVRGAATFSGAIISRAHAGVLMAQDSGVEIAAAEVLAHADDEQLLFRSELEGMATVPYLREQPFLIHYAWHASTPHGRFELRVSQQIGAATTYPPQPLWTRTQLYRCEASCTAVADAAGSAGTAGEVALGALPLRLTGLQEGDVLTGLRATIALDDPESGDRVLLSQLHLPDTTVPRRTVRLALADPSRTPEPAEFGAPVALDDGRFSAVLPRPNGALKLWARTCLGARCTSEATPLLVPTSLTLTPLPQVPYGTTAAFGARLADDRDAAIPGAAVEFSLDRRAPALATTDANGLASLEHLVTDLPGAYQVTARYAGDNTVLAPSTDTTTLVVVRAPATLDLTVQRQGPVTTMTARLTGPGIGQNGLAARTIRFTIDGVDAGTAQTGDDGTATLAVARPPKGNATYEASFAGDDRYEAASARA